MKRWLLFLLEGELKTWGILTGHTKQTGIRTISPYF